MAFGSEDPLLNDARRLADLTPAFEVASFVRMDPRP
jgi:hypothetical protein